MNVFFTPHATLKIRQLENPSIKPSAFKGYYCKIRNFSILTVKREKVITKCFEKNNKYWLRAKTKLNVLTPCLGNLLGTYHVIVMHIPMKERLEIV